MSEFVKADVVVIGAGPAGSAAALFSVLKMAWMYSLLIKRNFQGTILGKQFIQESNRC